MFTLRRCYCDDCTDDCSHYDVTRHNQGHIRFSTTTTEGQEAQLSQRDLQRAVSIDVLSTSLRLCNSLGVWCIGGIIGRINKVALHRTRLVLGWVTIFGWAV